VAVVDAAATAINAAGVITVVNTVVAIRIRIKIKIKIRVVDFFQGSVE
jgi:hypothetical protein